MEKNLETTNKVRSIIKEMDRKLEDFIKSDKYKDVLLNMGNLGRYSLINQIYIISQKSEASTVKGLREWNRLGRSVKKGEKAIRIIAPLKRKIRKDDEEEETISGYRLAYVFDISQTTGKDIEPFKIEDDGKVERKEEIMTSLQEVVSADGYRIEYASKEILGEDCYGLCNHKSKTILLLEGLNDVQEIATCIHECAHALAHNPYKEDFKGLVELSSRDIKEVEAESIACVVSSYLGLDTSMFNFAYISSWSNGDISKFRNNLEMIAKYSSKIIASLERRLSAMEQNPK